MEWAGGGGIGYAREILANDAWGARGGGEVRGPRMGISVRSVHREGQEIAPKTTNSQPRV